MTKKTFLFTVFLVIFGVLLSSSAMAINTEWQLIDWRAWGRLYDTSGNPLPLPSGEPNPFDGTTTQVLTPGVYVGTDGSEDAYGTAQVLNIRNTDTSDILWQMSATQELTAFFFGADDVKLNVLSATSQELFSTDFRIELWLDTTPDYDFTQGPGGRSNPVDPTFYNTVTDDGTLVLSLSGHELLIDNDPNQPYQVAESGNATTGAFFGSAYFDVTGGLWAPIFDTDGFTPANSSTMGTSDFDLSFSTLPNSAHNWTISGNGTAQNLMVPEPATLSLLGIGLLGIAAFGRKKYLK